MPDDVAGATAIPSLDSLAPSAQPATPPSPAPTPSAAPPTPPHAPTAAPAAGGASPTGDGGAAEFQRLLHSFGYQSADDFKREMDFVRRVRAEAERVEMSRRQSDPEHQAAARRGEALRALVSEGYSPEVAESLRSLPEISEFLRSQRADAAQRDLSDALGELGISSDGTKEGQELLAAWEEAVSDKLNANRELNARYFGTPAERRAAVRDVIAMEERRFNAALRGQNAQTLRDHAARTASMPRGARAGATLPRVRDEKPTATDPTLRRREGNVIQGRQLDDIWTHFGG